MDSTTSAERSPARPSRQRKLISVNNAHNLSKRGASLKKDINVERPLLQGLQMVNLTAPRLREDINLPTPTSSMFTTKTLTRERIAYDEKAQPRRSPQRVLRRLDSKDVQEAASPSLSEDEPDDNLSDFVVSDSASESELRRPPPSMRKKNTQTSACRPRGQRRLIISDDEDESEPSTKHKDAKALTDILKELSLNTFPDSKKATKTFREPEKPFRTNPDGENLENLQRCNPLDLHTPPTSPSKPKLKSPTKSRVVIPHSPHRQSIGAFWTQETINDWNDVYSPQKTQKVKKFFDFENDDADLSPSESPRRSPTKSPRKDKGVIERKKLFDSRKHALAIDFLGELDQVVAGGKLAELAKSTGGVKIVWSKTLNSTAGRAKWQREAIRTTETTSRSATSVTIYNHIASIELAEKVIDDEEKLLNVLAHEFCHLANFMVSNVKDQPHGKSFKEWAAKVTAKFPHKNILVTTKHSYTIDYKYIWGCVDCGIDYKRHSKSIDPVRHTCGACKGKLVQIKPVPRGRSGSSTAAGKKTAPNPYQAFVKKWYASVKAEYPEWKMKDVMSELARRYRLEKQSGVSDNATSASHTISVIEEVDVVVISGEDGPVVTEKNLSEQLAAVSLD